MGSLQARILEWVAMPSSGDLPNPGFEPRSPTLHVDSLPFEPLRKTMKNLKSILKSRDITLLIQFCMVKAVVSHVWMWQLGHIEGWALKNWCFWTVMLEKTLGSSLDCKEIKPVNPTRNQSWIYIVRTDSGAEALKASPPDWKCWLIEKDPDTGKDCG